MRKTTIIFTLLLLVFSASAVVYENGSSPSNNVEHDQMAITSGGSSAGSTVAVGPNGTKYTAEVSMRNRTANVSKAGKIYDISYDSNDKYSVNFSGNIQVPTPCHTIEHEIEENGTDYTLNIKSVDSGQMCVQRIDIVKYSGSFETDSDFTLQIQHNGENVKRLEHPAEDDSEKPNNSDDKPRGFIESLMNWLSNLLS